VSTVTYHNQPAVHSVRGSVPMDGVEFPYRVTKLLWPAQVEKFLQSIFIGKTLHLCCGMSQLGDIRFDIDPLHSPNVLGDVTRLPFADASVDTVLVDPPYTGSFQFNHDYLAEVVRVASKRVALQHWFLPCDRQGRYKKDHSWRLNRDLLSIWTPQSYFGRVQVISVFDKIG